MTMHQGFTCHECRKKGPKRTYLLNASNEKLASNVLKLPFQSQAVLMELEWTKTVHTFRAHPKRSEKEA